jgi:hypothetical protein
VKGLFAVGRPHIQCATLICLTWANHFQPKRKHSFGLFAGGLMSFGASNMEIERGNDTTPQGRLPMRVWVIPELFDRSCAAEPKRFDSAHETAQTPEKLGHK